MFNARKTSVDPAAHPLTYYTTGKNSDCKVDRRRNTRSRSATFSPHTFNEFRDRQRRASHEEQGKSKRFLIEVEPTLEKILEQEDTDGDFQITINDVGPKMLTLGTADSGGFNRFQVRGNYMLSNLLQELALAKDYGRKYIVLDESRLNENPVNRLSRMIRHLFWDGLTRSIDLKGLEMICADPKNQSSDLKNRVYVPHGEHDSFAYYQKLGEAKPNLNLLVEYLPEQITPEYVKSINDKPGILSLAMNKVKGEDGHERLEVVPFAVPGGRFNEMYGWDSYFIALGLLVDGRVELAKGMTENLAYQIKHYGKILNANRSYYLCRSQPPFLTDMAIKVYEHLDPAQPEQNKAWLREILRSAIKEYHTVWMAEPRLDPQTGLSRYYPEGLGIPPETEASHFDHIVMRYAAKHNVSIAEFDRLYNDGVIQEPELDAYFLHDRAVRESGHDTTYRLDGVCAHLATVDLNSLLYKYETDLADCIRDLLDDDLVSFDGQAEVSQVWSNRATVRRARIDQYLWNEQEGLYFDYHTVRKEQTTYETATAYWMLWAGCASESQARRMAKNLYKFEMKGGLVSGTERSRGKITLDRPNRQWDFPFGWAPHQIMAWEGFENYGLHDVAERLAYRFLYTITKAFVDFNGVVPEKFDVVTLSHQVEVEYGNVGIDFKYVPREGFGWMNTSFEVGIQYLSKRLKRALGTCTDPDLLFQKMLENEESRLTKAEKLEAISIRRQSTLAAQSIMLNESDTLVTRIQTNSINSPHPGEVFDMYMDDNEPAQDDSKLLPGSGEFLAPPPTTF